MLFNGRHNLVYSAFLPVQPRSQFMLICENATTLAAWDAMNRESAFPFPALDGSLGTIKESRDFLP
jgi:hypothetical protein